MIVLPVNSKIHGEQFIFIDGEDFDKVKDYNWCIIKDHSIFYAYANTKRINTKRKTIKMHRLLLDFPKNPIDHRDGNGLNNTRENIRICSSSENSMNQKKQNRDTSSRYKGVSWCKRDQKFRVRIIYHGKELHIGNFKDEHTAGEAYNKKALELFGEFANLNKIQREVV